MNVVSTPIFDEVKIVEPQVFGDERGFFLESYNRKKYAALGIEANFVQDNLSKSKRGILRGLHFQNPGAQGKLVQVLAGSVLDVVVDIRPQSPTFKKWFSIELSEQNKKQLWVPPGFAHGFYVQSEFATFFYKVTDYYRPECEYSLLWNDPIVGIVWPTATPILSKKDEAGKSIEELRPWLPS